MEFASYGKLTCAETTAHGLQQQVFGLLFAITIEKLRLFHYDSQVDIQESVREENAKFSFLKGQFGEANDLGNCIFQAFKKPRIQFLW